MDPHNDEQKSLFEAVDHFAEAMKKKLVSKQRSGWSGWDDTDRWTQHTLRRNMMAHILHSTTWGGVDVSESTFEPPNLVDMANFCMFLWNIAKKKEGETEHES